MDWLRGVKFDGSTVFTDSNDAIQREVGNSIWFSEFVPCGEDRIAEVLIWECHSVGLCWTIACEYAMYRGGKLASRPQSIDLYIACPLQTWADEIAVMLQEQPNPMISLGSVGFVFFPESSIRGNVLHYVDKYGGDVIVLRIHCICSVAPCGPRWNMDLTYHIWSTFEYYCTYYATLVLPTQTSGDKIVYERQYQAEVGGEITLRCGRCVCMISDPIPEHDFSCRIPQECTCVLCRKQSHLWNQQPSKMCLVCRTKENSVSII